MRIKIFVICILFSLSALSPKKEKKIFKKIYCSTISYCYGGRPTNIVVIYSTVNRYIIERSFTGLADNLNKRDVVLLGTIKLDSTWLPVLRKADEEKHNLKHYQIPELKLAGFGIWLLSKDSISKSSQDVGREGYKKLLPMISHVELSSVLLFKKKAIVEVGRTNGPLSGEGMIYFLQKIKGSWVVVSYLSIWIS